MHALELFCVSHDSAVALVFPALPEARAPLHDRQDSMAELDIRAELAFIKQQLAQLLGCWSRGQCQQPSCCQEQRKRVCGVDDSSLTSPLDKDELLDAVFTYVGVGEYFFAAGVCRRWRGRYIKLCYNKAALAVKVDKLRTSFKSAIVTAARLHLALTGSNSLTIAELQANDNTLAKQITRYALDPIAVLTLARVRELTWTTWLCEGAACNNKLELLKWLRESGCPWEEVPVCTGCNQKWAR
jgi:hypothetical protein